MSKRHTREIERIDKLINSFQQHSEEHARRNGKLTYFGEVIHQLRYERMLVATQIGKKQYGRSSNLRRSR